MPPGLNGAGRTVRILAILTVLSACLGAVVAYGSSRAGGDEVGLKGQVPVTTPPTPTKVPKHEAPPRVSFIEKPEAISTSSAVQFRFHVPPRTQRREPTLPGPASSNRAERPLRQFQCRHDGGPWQDCGSPRRLSLPTGSHSVAVRALAHTGQPGPVASYSWTQLEPKPIAIEPVGSIEDLHPGFPTQSLPVVVSNPNDVPVEVTRLTVELPTDPPSCPAENFELIPAGISAAFPLAIAARASVSLPSETVSAPAIRMLNRAANQDACQGAQLQLVFHGEARG